MDDIPSRVTLYAGGDSGWSDAGVLCWRVPGSRLPSSKNGDFLRDFRGDTIIRRLQLMHELGLLEAFLQRPHQKISELHGMIGDSDITIADFSHLPTQCRFIAMMPQWIS